MTGYSTGYSSPYAGYYGAAYSGLAAYFGQSGGTGSPGKAGGAGYNNDATLSSGASSSGDQQAPSASSGSGWISAAASSASTDKSFFSTPFEQSFGGISNNQTYVIGSPNADVTGATQPFSPITAPPTIALPGGGSLSLSPLTIAIVAAIVGVIALKFLK